ncbi:MAG: hypothetical protein KF774_09350 [Planctomyces sp.]|nr:hypothetical protein [Planctomyces sp.]
MAWRPPYDDDWMADADYGDDLEENLDDEDELEDDEDEENATVECPKCGADMYEDAVRCPLCGEYFVRRHTIWQDKPLWWKLVGLLGIIAVLWSLSLAMR